jgi:hypothetical protein
MNAREITFFPRDDSPDAVLALEIHLIPRLRATPARPRSRRNERPQSLKCARCQYRDGGARLLASRHQFGLELRRVSPMTALGCLFGNL